MGEHKKLICSRRMSGVTTKSAPSSVKRSLPPAAQVPSTPFLGLRLGLHPMGLREEESIRTWDYFYGSILPGHLNSLFISLLAAIDRTVKGKTGVGGEGESVCDNFISCFIAWFVQDDYEIEPTHFLIRSAMVSFEWLVMETSAPPLKFLHL